MAESSLGPLVAAIDALYGTDNHARGQADEWLKAFTKETQAWSSCMLLLQNASASIAARTFVAQTLRRKTITDLYQLEATSQWSLKDTLLACLASKQLALTRTIKGQICAALAVLALQLEDWDANRVVEDAIQALQGDEQDLLVTLLQYLSALPNELTNSAHVPISDEQYQHRLSDILDGNASRVMTLLNDFVQAGGKVEREAFLCLSEWIKSGVVPVLALGTGELLPRLFAGLRQDDKFDNAVDACCAIIHETQDLGGFEELIRVILQQLTALKPALQQAIAEEDTDKLTDFGRLYAEAAETYASLCVADPAQYATVIEAMADLVSYRDLEIVPVTFAFWYKLARLLALAKNEQARPQFVPLFTRLLHVMILHLRYPDEESSWTPKERDDFRDFRHEMGDTLKDCCAVLSFQVCLQSALTRINEALVQNMPWQDLEAPLFSLRAMGSAANLDDQEFMPQILAILPKLPSHPKIQYASTLVISRYSQWTARHPESLGDQLTYVSNGFEQPEVKAAAALAFKHLCNDCSQHLVALLPQLEPFYHKLSRGLSGEELEDATDAIGSVISSCNGPEQVAALRRVCLPLIQDLADTQASTQGSERLVLIDRLAALGYLLRAVERPEDTVFTDECVDLVNQVWPLLDHILAENPADIGILEHVGTVIRRGLNFYESKAVGVAPSFANRIAQGFLLTGDASYLWMGEKFLRTFAALSPDLRQLSKSCIETCCSKVLEESSKGHAKDLALMIDDFVHFCLAGLEVIPETVIPSPVLPAALQVAHAGLDLFSVDTIQICLDLIRDLLSRLSDPVIVTQTHTNADGSRKSASTTTDPTLKQVVQGLFTQFGPAITATLLTNLALSFPEDASYNVATIMRLMALGLPADVFQHCISYAAQQLPTAERPLLAAERDKFLSMVSSALTNGTPSKVREATNAFRARTSMLRARVR